MQIQQNELRALLQEIGQAERTGFFERMFQDDCSQPGELPTAAGLLQSIRPEMSLKKSFFLKIYGYSQTAPEYAAQAVERLQTAGCSKAPEYYKNTVLEYQRKKAEERRSVVVRMPENTTKGGKWVWIPNREQQKQAKIEDLQQKSDSELLNLLQKLN